MDLTRKQSRRIDEIAIREFGIPGIVLMENAGRSCAEFLAANTGGSILILCGNGNNGGDGFVIARHLANRSRECSVILTSAPGPMSKPFSDADINRKILENSGVEIRLFESGAGELRMPDGSFPDVIVEAVLGTGAVGPPRPPTAAIIEAANRRDATRVAIDLPAGLDCDDGTIHNPAFRADHTLTFVTRKPGFNIPGTESVTGQVHIMDIGIPDAVLHRVVSRE